MSDNDTKILIWQLFEIVTELRRLYPSRRFPLDGMLVGDLGEVLAAKQFDLTLEPQSRRGRDARIRDGRRVEVKTTALQKGGYAAFRPGEEADLVLALRLRRDGTLETVYNGPAEAVYAVLPEPGSNGQARVSFAKLASLQLAEPALP